MMQYLSGVNSGELSFQMLKDTLVSAPILKISPTLLNLTLYLQMPVSMDGQEC